MGSLWAGMALPGVVAGQSLPSVEDYPQTTTITPAEGVAGFRRNRWPPSIGIAGHLASESLAALRRNPQSRARRATVGAAVPTSAVALPPEAAQEEARLSCAAA